MKQILLISCLLITIISKAEQAPFGISEVLFNTNLIAHVKITSHTQDNFTVKVINVLHHHRSSIQPGHYIRIKNDFSIVCPAAFPIKYAVQKREALAFLSYHKGNWYITQNEIGFFKSNKVRISFPKQGYYYHGTIAEWKADLTDYFAHFSIGSDKKIIPQFTQEQLKGKVFSDLVWLQYRALYLLNESKHSSNTNLETSFAYVEDVVEIDSTQNNVIRQVVKREPIPQDSVKNIQYALLEYIDVNHPEIKEASISGTTLFALLFEKDGTISETKILRSIHPTIDAAIITYFETHKDWLPPLDEDDQPTRYQQHLPLRIF